MVPGVSDPAVLNQLISNGFTHYHVLCSNATMNTRPKHNQGQDKLSASLESQIRARLADKASTNKLRVIWSDTTKMPTDRFFSIEEAAGMMPEEVW